MIRKCEQELMIRLEQKPCHRFAVEESQASESTVGSILRIVTQLWRSETDRAVSRSDSGAADPQVLLPITYV